MLQFSKWSNTRLAAACIFPRLDIDNYIVDNSYANEIKELVKLGCGGFCIFGGNKEQVRSIITNLQMLADIPLIFCSDFENGLSMRIEDGISYPHAWALARSKWTSEISNAIASEAKDIGILWNFAPVCDINSNPANPVINIRSFGESADIVIKKSVEYITGTQAQKVAACAKHFPGHGNTSIDSHINIPVIDKLNDELLPFVEAIKNNVKSIMVGHIIIKEIDDEYPASLSKKIITDLLKNKLNYKDIVITDGLDMKAITNNYSQENIVELAINAGNDILLLPQNPILAIQHLIKLIEQNPSLKEQIIKSISKIYKLKQWTELIPNFTHNENKIKLFNENLKLALKAAIDAIEITNNKENMLPISETQTFAAFAILQKDEDIQPASRFFTMLAQATENDCQVGYLDENITNEDMNALITEMEAEFIIFAIFYRGRGYSKTLGSISKIQQIIQKLSADKKKIILFFGDPYLEKHINGEVNIKTYSDSFASLAAAVMILTDRKIELNDN